MLRGDLLRRFLALLLFCSAVTGSLAAQIVDASICEILANPPSFDERVFV